MSRTGTRTAKTSVRRELIENEIIQHASRLFAERGFAGTSLQDVAEAMGITRPALYYYVKSKDELLARLVTEITEGGAAEIRAIATDDARDARTKLGDIAGLIAGQRASDPARFLLLVRSESELPPELAKANETAKRDTLRVLIEVIEQGMTSGEFRPVEPRTTALAIVGMCNWVAWWSHPGSGSSTKVAGQLASLAIAMVAGQDGQPPREASPLAALARMRDDIDFLEQQLNRAQEGHA